MSGKLSILAGQYSQRGLKEHNEDSCAIYVPKDSLLNTKGIVVAIADGVSSSVAGREASETCVKSLVTDYYSTPESWSVKSSCQKVLGALNRWLYGQSRNLHHHSGQGMLTTLSALVLKSATGHLFHVGDTRIYRLRGSELECLTQDHHHWASDKRAFLSRAMGADVNVKIDYRAVDLQPRDLFCLTTDGVHEYVRHEEMLGLIKENITNLEKAAREIVTKALENGSNDNVSCQLCIVEALPHLDAESFYQQLSELPFPPPLAEGMILDGYKIAREIHASKRTQVYLAVDQESGERVALKTPSVNYEDDPAYIDGFLHEEWAGRRINSPHVLRVLESRRPRRFLYYITEYVEGETLRQWMNDNPQPSMEQVRAIIEQLIKGVRAFQRQEMVHQDLKPENIMLDALGTVKIVDFGSTKIAGIQEIAKPIERGQLLGTLDYAAPEYFEGHAGTHQSDIYSIAVIVYEMLCGQLPYGNVSERMVWKRAQYRTSRQYNEKIPDWIDAALEKGTRIDSARRYQTLSEFFQDLTSPNAALLKSHGVALIEKNPLAFWQGISLLLLCICLLLLFLLIG